MALIFILSLPAGEDWKITVVTGDFETAGTTATVSLYAYGENKTSGPLILGSGKHQLFNCNSVDTFKVLHWIDNEEFTYISYSKRVYSTVNSMNK